MDFDTSTIFVGLLALFVAAYGALAAALTRRSISPAFAFMLIGIVIAGVAVGAAGLSVPTSHTLGVLAEVTLALLLFTGASSVHLGSLRADSAIVLRLLAIGLPLTIALGTVMALGFFPGIGLGVALVIGAILAPTDADLGHQVVTDRSVPARVRRVLNVESGLNDGIVAPVVMVAIAIAVSGDFGEMRPVTDAVVDLALAILLGIAVGGGGLWIMVQARDRQLSTPASRQLATLAIAIAAYAITAGVGGSGFIAAFVAGLAYGRGSKEEVGRSVEFTDALAALLSIVVWLVFGIVFVHQHVLDFANPMAIVYAVLALTVMRMVPVAIALIGTGFSRATVAFVGWFGPRGLASIVFGVIAVVALEESGTASEPLAEVVGWTVIFSVVLHGFSAMGLAARYGRFAEGLADDSPERVGDRSPRSSRWVLRGKRPLT